MQREGHRALSPHYFDNDPIRIKEEKELLEWYNKSGKHKEEYGF